MKPKITIHDFWLYEAAMANLIEFRCDKSIRRTFYLILNGEKWGLRVCQGRLQMWDLGTLNHGIWNSTVSDWILSCVVQIHNDPFNFEK